MLAEGAEDFSDDVLATDKMLFDINTFHHVVPNLKFRIIRLEKRLDLHLSYEVSFARLALIVVTDNLVPVAEGELAVDAHKCLVSILVKK